MTFDWFRRQYDEKPADSQPVEPAPPQPEPESAEAQTPAVSEDYLNWAKAAYESIRQRQKSQVEESADTPAAEAVTSPEAVATANEAEAIESPAIVDSIAETETTSPLKMEPTSDEPAPLSADIESTAIEPSPSDAIAEPKIVEPVAEPVTAAEALTPMSSVSDQLDTDTAPVESTLPFWAQAEAERQARLERLKETAIVEPEPALPVAVTSTPEVAADAVEEPAMALDEGFIWSAEVLAAQGRRPDQVSLEEITWLKRLRQGLDKTRRSLINQLRAVVGQGPLNQDAVLEIESLLLQADVGVEATDYIIESLQNKLRQEVLPPDAAIAYLKQILRDMLDRPLGKSYNPTFAPEKDTFNIWLITGVNGAGKTTTIGKIAHLAQKSGYRCLIAAADTFRAAAVEQVKVWGDRSGVEVISNPGQNTDPAAVVFDAITAAQARGAELLLVDTAGRLQNKKNLMDELSKIRRIIDKKADNAVVESLLVLDATLGQNGLRQAEVFSQAAQLSGVVLTKLDGTARGGIALAVVQQLGLPIRFIGAGEGIEDLRPFSSYEFVEALLSG